MILCLPGLLFLFILRTSELFVVFQFLAIDKFANNEVWLQLDLHLCLFWLFTLFEIKVAFCDLAEFQALVTYFVFSWWLVFRFQLCFNRR
jgi:hypothetical protein